MKRLLALAAIALVGFTSGAAQAHDQVEDSQTVWACGLDFEGTAEGFQIIVGSFTSRATGELHCQDNEGNTYNRKVRVNMQTEPLGPVVGFGSFRFAGGAANITLIGSSPRALFGEYIVASGRAAVIGGVGAFTALKVDSPELALEISLQVLEGFGVEAGFTKMTLQRL
jgi:hypothetical protein